MNRMSVNSEYLHSMYTAWHKFFFGNDEAKPASKPQKPAEPEKAESPALVADTFENPAPAKPTETTGGAAPTSIHGSASEAMARRGLEGAD